MPYQIELTLSGLAIAGAVRRDLQSAKQLAHRHIRERGDATYANAALIVDRYTSGNLDVPVGVYVLQLRQF